MNTVGIYLLYLVISIGLTMVVGTGVARSGRAFLLDVFSGNDTLARAVSRLIVLGFYLLSLGFVALAMRAGGQVSSAIQGLQLLSVKVGEVLLVLGALHLLTIGALIRARRLAQSRIAESPQQSPARSLPRRNGPTAWLPAVASGENAGADAGDSAAADDDSRDPARASLAGSARQ